MDYLTIEEVQVFYVINASTGAQITVKATHDYAARLAAYRQHPEWRGDWIVTQDKQPTQELLKEIMKGYPESD